MSANVCRAAVAALLAAVAVAAVVAQTVPQQDPAKRERAEELMRRVNKGGAPLTDAELAELLDYAPAETVDVSMVMVPVLVLDRWGRPISGLEAGDFQVEEAGRRRKIAWFSEEQDRPVRVALLLDVSESMGTPVQSERTKQALLPLLWAFGRRDKMTLLGFAAEEVATYGDWTEEPLSLYEKALAIPRRGKTAVIDALRESSELLPRTPGERQAIVLISDGVDNASVTHPGQVVSAARSVGVPIYVLAVGGREVLIQEKRANEENRPGNSPLLLLRQIARMTGGRFFFIEDERRAKQAAETIRDDLRHQYWLGFRPGKRPDGTYRTLRVTVDRSGATVLARAGYRQ